MHHYEGMGRDLPAGKAAEGAERLRLPAAAADALFYPKSISSFSTKAEKTSRRDGGGHLALLRGDGTQPAGGQGCGRRGTPAAARGGGRCATRC